MSSIYSRAAFLAQNSLKERGIEASKGHIREVAAALHGFGSLAAMRAAMPLGLEHTPRAVAVLPDKALARRRADELAASADPSALVLEVEKALTLTATPEHFYLANINAVPRQLLSFARKIALLRPEMQGVVDDYDERVRQSVERVVVQTGQPIDPGQEQLLRRLSENNGPVVIHEWASDPHPAGQFYRLVGDYATADGQTGIVHIHILYQQLSKTIYGFHHGDVVFTEGPGYEEAFGSEHLSELSEVGGMG